MKTIIFKPIHSIKTEMELIEEFLSENDDDHNEVYDGNTELLNDPIKIDNLIHHLETLKLNGATYTSISFNDVDMTYTLDGQIVELLPPISVTQFKRPFVKTIRRI